MTSCVVFSSDNNPESRQLCATFSEDGKFFATGTRDGFVVYCTEPFVPLTVREVGNGGVSLISMFARSNILLLVSPDKPKTCVVWNEAKSATSSSSSSSSSPKSGGPVGAISCTSEIVAIRLHQHFIAIADTSEIHIFNTAMEKIHTFKHHPSSRDRHDGAKGLPSFTIAGCLFDGGNSNNRIPIAFADAKKVGRIRFVHLQADASLKIVDDHSADVHNSAVSCVTFTQNCQLVASCATGTAVWLTRVATGEKLLQFSPRSQENIIFSLCTWRNDFCASVSHSGKIHFFAIPPAFRSQTAAQQAGNVRVPVPKDDQDAGSIVGSVWDFTVGAVVKGVNKANDWMGGASSVAEFDIQLIDPVSYGASNICFVNDNDDDNNSDANNNNNDENVSGIHLFVAHGASGKIGTVLLEPPSTAAIQAAHANNQTAVAARCSLLKKSSFEQTTSM